jgi:ribosomal protein S24E
LFSKFGKKEFIIDAFIYDSKETKEKIEAKKKEKKAEKPAEKQEEKK